MAMVVIGSEEAAHDYGMRNRNAISRQNSGKMNGEGSPSRKEEFRPQPLQLNRTPEPKVNP